MSKLKNPQDALAHPALKGQAHRMTELYLRGERFETFFAQCDVPYTRSTHSLFDQARGALGILQRKKTGKVNPAWNGAKPRYRKGYRYVEVPGTFDKTGRTCWRPEHHLVMEKKLGRPLLKTEVVHHIDEDPLNNAPENLKLFSSNGNHLAATLKGKCPRWSETGRQAILRAARSKRVKKVVPDVSSHT